MLWKPYEPIYPKLVKNVADGLTFEERKEMRNGGLNYVPWMKLSRIMNGPLMRPFIPKNAGFGAPCSYSIQGRAEYSLEGQKKSGAGTINCLSMNFSYLTKLEIGVCLFWIHAQLTETTWIGLLRILYGYLACCEIKPTIHHPSP
ncbi:hypothetical protein DKX38_017896 [Salix brachista]|uniref:Uncharacterized protein n=1 Tax=Salix brachista TaxID=2182728 RepID=A0A5N5KWN5_9ROSI|nr:hypothetical protein DKX38_017896 [Salix brachista]